MVTQKKYRKKEVVHRSKAGACETVDSYKGGTKRGAGNNCEVSSPQTSQLCAQYTVSSYNLVTNLTIDEYCSIYSVESHIISYFGGEPHERATIDKLPCLPFVTRHSYHALFDRSLIAG